MQDLENPLVCWSSQSTTQQSEATYYSAVCLLFLGSALKLLHSENPFSTDPLCCSIMQVVGYGFKSALVWFLTWVIIIIIIGSSSSSCKKGISSIQEGIFGFKAVQSMWLRDMASFWWRSLPPRPPPPTFVVPYHCTTLAVANKHPGIIGKDCMLIFYDCHQLVMCILFCWALHSQGQGLWHWIQLLEVLPYYNLIGFFGESVYIGTDCFGVHSECGQSK